MEICEETQDKCMVCYECNNPETMVKCKECSLMVHSKCYGVTAKSLNQWKCRYCIYNEEHNIDPQIHNYIIKCRICNQKTFGALKPCANNDGFAHLVCALWTSFTFVRNQYHMSPIHNIQECKKYKKILEKFHCMICSKNFATIKCRVKNCKYYYHPSCLIGTTDEKQNKCMVKQNFIVEKMQSTMYYVYCPKHASLHQAFNPLRVTRKNRTAAFNNCHMGVNVLKDEQKTVQNKNNKNNDVEMGVCNENKTDFNQIAMNNMNEEVMTLNEWDNDMFNDDGMVYNNEDNNYLQDNTFGTQLSPPICNNSYMYKIGSNIDNNVSNVQGGNVGIQSHNSVDMDSSMGDIGGGYSGVIAPQQQHLYRSNTTTPSTVSGMSASRSRAPMPFMNGFEQPQQQQMQYHTQQMGRNNNNNNNDPNINFASFF